MDDGSNSSADDEDRHGIRGQVVTSVGGRVSSSASPLPLHTCGHCPPNDPESAAEDHGHDSDKNLAHRRSGRRSSDHLGQSGWLRRRTPNRVSRLAGPPGPHEVTGSSLRAGVPPPAVIPELGRDGTIVWLHAQVLQGIEPTVTE